MHIFLCICIYRWLHPHPLPSYLAFLNHLLKKLSLCWLQAKAESYQPRYEVLLPEGHITLSMKSHNSALLPGVYIFSPATMQLQRPALHLSLNSSNALIELIHPTLVHITGDQMQF